MSTFKSRVTVTASLLALALGTAACGGGAAGGGSDAGSSDTEPLRIGVAAPGSGAFAVYSQEHKAAFEFAAEEANAAGGVDGRQVELYYADSLGTPEGTVAAAQKLVQQDNARFLVGPVSSSNTLAVVQRLQAWDAIQFGVQSQLDALTGAECNPRFFRTNMSDEMIFNALVAWLEDNPQGSWDQISSDYAWGRDAAALLVEEVQKASGTVGANLFAPLGSADWAAFISQLDGGDALMTSLAGSDAINFFTQALQFGALDKYDLVLGNASFLSSTFEALDDERLVGAWGTANWMPSVATPETEAFVKAFTDKTGEAPADTTGFAYMAMQTIFAGVEAAGSVEPSEVAKALEGLEINTIKGDVTMRAEDHQLAQPVYMGQIERTDSGLRLVMKESYPADEIVPEPSSECQMG